MRNSRLWRDLLGVEKTIVDDVEFDAEHQQLVVSVRPIKAARDRCGQLVWAEPGRDKATVAAFFTALGPERCAPITHVSADGAAFIADVVGQRCPNAVRCADPYHVVAWATAALDVVRRQIWNEARAAARKEPKRGRGRPRADAPPPPSGELAKKLKGARYSLWKNPENLKDHQREKLAWIATTSPKLHRAYLLKEGLRLIFQMTHEHAVVALQRWLVWARRCQIPAFIDWRPRSPGTATRSSPRSSTTCRTR